MGENNLNKVRRVLNHNLSQLDNIYHLPVWRSTKANMAGWTFSVKSQCLVKKTDKGYMLELKSRTKVDSYEPSYAKVKIPISFNELELILLKLTNAKVGFPTQVKVASGYIIRIHRFNDEKCGELVYLGTTFEDEEQGLKMANYRCNRTALKEVAALMTNLSIEY